MNRNAFLLFLTVFVYASPMHAGGEALFGLTWGMTKSDLVSSGVSLEEAMRENNLIGYQTNSLPKDLRDAEKYQLLVDDQLGLVKIMLISKNIENDPYGSSGKERFAELEATLTKKYTPLPGSTLKRTGIKLWDERDEFYQCLAYAGCGMWAAHFQAANMAVGLQLKGLSRGQGYYQLSAEADPEFGQSISRKKKFEADDEEDAL